MKMTGLATVAAVMIAAVLALAQPAAAFGPGAALGSAASSAPAAMPVHGWCHWKGGCAVTPQYFRYRPPSLGPRCFKSIYGDVHCPYAERPDWWRGCWMNRYGRLTCQKGAKL